MDKLEYVVTLHNYDDLDSFYTDMETDISVGCHVPDRVVDCNRRRPTSRNTHYFLTREEASVLKNDPRVLSVTLAELGRMIHPSWTETGNWDKSTTNNSTYKNWGLYRCTLPQSPPGWDFLSAPTQTGTINVTASGKNVDVVIVDGHIDPTHPEFAVSPDGTGGSRVNQINWFSFNSIVDGLDNDGRPVTAATDYMYSPYSSSNTDMTLANNHGAHVAGIVAGNTQGWARDATLYNINPYGSNPNGTFDSLLLWDYIRAFHRGKSVNPETGIKNPTICNCSYGVSISYPHTGSYEAGPITDVTYRGITISTSTSFSDNTLKEHGIYAAGGVATIPFFDPSVAADIRDAISDGIIIIGAAGNEYFKIDVPGGLDYSNTFIATYGIFQYLWDTHQGTTPGSAANVVCVGAAGALAAEWKAPFSNCGPRVDIYAPGSYITSSFNNTLSFSSVADPRNASYVIGKISGTSMASSQVTGILASILEIYPRFNQANVREYLSYYAKIGQLADTGGGAGDTASLQSSANRYLFSYKERQDIGNVYPKSNQGIRPAQGLVFPRPKIYRYGS
jgi:hypothetical protein